MAKELSTLEKRINCVKTWPLRKGKSELLRHLEGGEPTTRSEAMAAKCYDCMCGYEEIGDCGITTCPLHPWMPYREDGPRKSRTLSDEQRAAASERLKKARSAKG